MDIFKTLNKTCIKAFKDKGSIVLKDVGGDVPLEVIHDRNSVKYVEETETSVRTKDPVLSIDKGSIPAGIIIAEESIIEIEAVPHRVRDVVEDSAYMIKLDLTRV